MRVNLANRIKIVLHNRHMPLLIILILSAYTHLWNPIGFPTIHGDEAHYLRRAMHTLDGLGPQEEAWSDHPFDHPYFGQIFLAAVLGIVGYPDSIHPTVTIQSMELLYIFPRILMGLLAVLDTFLIYKIAEKRYSKDVALIAAILFAVMPLTWFVRRILLDSILLPFLLSSILFGVLTNRIHEDNKGNIIPMILISGIFMGISIFTKVPAASMIPIVAYLVLSSDRNYIKKLKSLGIWFIPVILIPAIWPLYSISIGEFEKWYGDVMWQADRQGSGFSSLISIFKLDPLLTSIAIMGVIFSVIRRDYLPILWTVPFIFFIEYAGFTQDFYWIIVLPAFCVAGSLLISALVMKTSGFLLNYRNISALVMKTKSILLNYRNISALVMKTKSILLNYRNKRSAQKSIDQYLIDSSVSGPESNTSQTLYRKGISYNSLLGIVLFILGTFGILSTSALINSNLTSNYFALYTFIVEQLLDYDKDSRKQENTDNKVTMIADKRWIAEFVWVPKYVFDKDYNYRATNLRTLDLSLREPFETNKILLIVDTRLMKDLTRDSGDVHIQQLKKFFNNTRTVATFDDSEQYKKLRDLRFNFPFTSMADNRDIGHIEVRSN